MRPDAVHFFFARRLADRRRRQRRRFASLERVFQRVVCHVLQFVVRLHLSPRAGGELSVDLQSDAVRSMSGIQISLWREIFGRPVSRERTCAVQNLQSRWL